MEPTESEKLVNKMNFRINQLILTTAGLVLVGFCSTVVMLAD